MFALYTEKTYILNKYRTENIFGMSDFILYEVDPLKMHALQTSNWFNMRYTDELIPSSLFKQLNYYIYDI